jgi:acyl carrier protein
VTRSLSDVARSRSAIRAKIVDLARRRGIDASSLQDMDVIPESGVLDSVGILELITWFEMTFDITIPQPDLSVENFGTIDAMVSYLEQH